MNEVGALWETALPRAGLYLVLFLTVGVALIGGIRFLTGSYAAEMVLRTMVNLLCAVAAVVLIYEGSRIGNLYKVLGEEQGLYLSGGSQHGPVASEEELSSLWGLCRQGWTWGAVSLGASAIGIGLQLRRRQVRHEASNAPKTDL